MYGAKSDRSLEHMTDIYKLVCDEYNKFYEDQTGRTFHQVFNEHLPKRNIEDNRSNYVHHLIDEHHDY